MASSRSVLFHIFFIPCIKFAIKQYFLSFNYQYLHKQPFGFTRYHLEDMLRQALHKCVIVFLSGGNTANVFSINSTGAIVTTTALDRETRDNYELTVRATDHGAHAHLSSVKVLVSVTDTNDNAPNFTNVPSEVLVSESTLPGTGLFRL